MERIVRTVKGMLLKSSTSQQMYDALMVYRSTALSHSTYSPAELLMGRRLKTALPQVPSQLQPTAIDHQAFREADATQKSKSTCHYNLRHRARDLPPLQPGDVVTSVAGPGGKERATVVAPGPEPRSYSIQTSSGVVVRRNRHDLRKLPGHDRIS